MEIVDIFSLSSSLLQKAVYNARHWNHPDSEELPAFHQ